jgi:O-antigen/teichoic acid export membrane protein
VRAVRRIRELTAALPVGVLAGAFPFAAANLMTALTSIAGIMLLTRLLDPAGYGRYAAILALVVLAHGALFSWLQSGIVRFHTRADGEADEARLATLIRFAFVASGLLLVLAAMVARPWLALAGLSGQLGLAGLLLAVLRGWLSLAQAWNRALGLSWRFARVEMVSSAGGLVLATLGLLALPGHPAVAVAGMAAGSAIAILMSPEPLRIRRETRSLEPLLREMLSYGIPLSLVFLAGSLLAMSDRLLITYLVGPVTVGVYSVAFAIADRAINLVMLPVPVAAKPLVFAAYERGGEAEAQRLLRESAGWLMALGFPAATVLILAPEPITALLIGGGMADRAAEIVPWLAVGSLLSAFVSLHFSLAFQLSRRTTWLLAAVGPPALLNIVANIVLLPRFGMIAAAWTTVGSYALTTILAVAIGRRHVRIPFPAAPAARALAACIPLGLVLVGRNDDDPIILLWIAGGLILYAIVLMALVLLTTRQLLLRQKVG